MLVLFAVPFTASYSCKSIYMAEHIQYDRKLLRIFTKISASSFLALYEINEIDLRCY